VCVGEDVAHLAASGIRLCHRLSLSGRSCRTGRPRLG
jgi:hypothetical protein